MDRIRFRAGFQKKSNIWLEYCIQSTYNTVQSTISMQEDMYGKPLWKFLKALSPKLLGQLANFKKFMKRNEEIK